MENLPEIQTPSPNIFSAFVRGSVLLFCLLIVFQVEYEHYSVVELNKRIAPKFGFVAVTNVVCAFFRMATGSDFPV